MESKLTIFPFCFSSLILYVSSKLTIIERKVMYYVGGMRWGNS